MKDNIQILDHDVDKDQSEFIKEEIKDRWEIRIRKVRNVVEGALASLWLRMTELGIKI